MSIGFSMPIGITGLFVIAIIIAVFIKEKKIKIPLIGVTITFLIFGYWILYNVFHLYNLNSIGIGFAIIMIFLGSIFLIKEKHKEKQEKGIDTAYESSLVLRIVSFLIPLVGLIVYAVNIVQNPKIAKECGKFALIGFSLAFISSSIAIICIYFA